MTVILEELDLTRMDVRLRSLSENEVVLLVNRYFDGENVSKLIDEYKINITPAQLCSSFPPVKSDEKCATCDGNIVYPMTARVSKGKIQISRKKKYCISCRHNKGERCKCGECSASQAILKRKKAEMAEKIVQSKRDGEQKKLGIIKKQLSTKPIRYEEDLTMGERIYLAVIIRAAMTENMTHIEVTYQELSKLSPTKDFSLEILRLLINRHLLIVDAGASNLDAFTNVTEDNFTYDMLRVKYRLNIMPTDYDTEGMNGLIKRLMYPDPSLFSKEFCYEMWKRISFEESKHYLLYKMKKAGYSYTWGEKTTAIFEFLVENFSVAQIYNIIYRAIANSAARLQAGEITKIHAQNAIIVSCERQGERAIAEGWNLKGFRQYAQESIINEVLFTSIMKISYLGFAEKPTPNF